MMKQNLGPGYFNLILRRLSTHIASYGEAYLKHSGITAPARTTSVLAFLARYDLVSIADIAQGLGFTHQNVSKMVAQLEKLGLVKSSSQGQDQRKKSISLTKAGREEEQKIAMVAHQAEGALKEIFDDIGVDLYDGLLKLEQELDRRPLYGRLMEQEEKSSAIEMG